MVKSFLDGQILSALCSPAIENVLARLGGVTLEEAVRSSPLDAAGLVSALDAIN